MWFHLSQARDSTSSSPLTSLRYAAFLYLPRTPLHCAASCNNLPMVRFLVEHGACVFATTISDHETAADKCEEDEDGYDSCSDYLYSKCGLFSCFFSLSFFFTNCTMCDQVHFIHTSQSAMCDCTCLPLLAYDCVCEIGCMFFGSMDVYKCMQVLSFNILCIHVMLTVAWICIFTLWKMSWKDLMCLICDLF